MSANIPPDPAQTLAQKFNEIDEQLSELTCLLAALLAEFARRTTSTQHEGISLLKEIVAAANRDIEQERASRATIRELAELLMRKADPWKPDA